jgi:hypothetical protein
VHEDTANADRVGRLNDALRSIPKETTTETASLKSAVEGEARQNDNGNWVTMLMGWLGI